MSKNQERRDKFQKLGHALSALDNEFAWRDRKGDHEFRLKPTVVHDDSVTARTAGGPAMKTWQYERGVRRGA
jgi:hypothetical protein